MTYSVKTQDPLRAQVGCCNSVLSGSRDGVILTTTPTGPALSGPDQMNPVTGTAAAAGTSAVTATRSCHVDARDTSQLFLPIFLKRGLNQ